MIARRVLITGVSRFVGSSIARALEDDSRIEYIGGIDVVPPTAPLNRTEFIRADIRNPMIRRVLASTQADTVVHTDLVSTPIRAGGRLAQKEKNVIGTMQLLAACQHADHILRVVVRSSSAVYGIDPRAPSLITEDQSILATEAGYSKDIADAESFARDFARRRPDVVVTILRMTNVVGPKTDSSMVSFFSLPLVPTALGYDPRMQFVHEDDEIEVLRRAIVEDHPGVFNVAGDGIIYLSQALRIARRIPVPVVAPLARILADALRTIGIADFPTDQINLIIHGRVMDNTRLKTVFGYQPKYSTVDAFRSFVESRSSKGHASLPSGGWEKDLYRFLMGSLGGSVGPEERFVKSR